MNNLLGLIFISIGILADIFACLGLLRFPDVYNRLQVSTKCVTLGTCGIFFGVFLESGFTALGIKSLLIILFILLTSPVSAHALSRAAHKSAVKLCEKSVCDKYKEDGNNKG